MLLPAYEDRDVESAIREVTHSLYEHGYRKTQEILGQLPKAPRRWQRQHAVLPKSLKALSKELDYDFYQLVLETEESYAVGRSDPTKSGEVTRNPAYIHDPMVSYTIGLSNNLKSPEFVVSGMSKINAEKLILKVVDTLTSRGRLDLGEPLKLDNQTLIFKQFDTNHNVLPLLSWFNSFQAVPVCQILYSPYPWEDPIPKGTEQKLKQRLYWTCPFQYY